MNSSKQILKISRESLEHALSNAERHSDPHLTDRQVFGYVGCTLSDVERREVEEHIQRCSSCNQEVAEMQQIHDSWRAGSSQAPVAAVGSATGPEVLSVTVEQPETASHSGQDPVVKPAPKDYFSQQLVMDDVAKKRTSLWLLQNHPIRDQSGIMVDAGSHNMFLYEQVQQSVADHHLRDLTVLTNSLPVINSWVELQAVSPIVGTTVDVAGGVLDAAHRAFYGAQEHVKLASILFDYVYIGCAGIAVDEGRLLLGYQGGRAELDSKRSLLKLNCRARFLLGTARKIGNPGARGFDLIPAAAARPEVPIYLITDGPSSREQQTNFEHLRSALLGGKLHEQILRRKLTFHWIVLDCSREQPLVRDHIEISPKVYRDLGDQVDESFANRPRFSLSQDEDDDNSGT